MLRSEGVASRAQGLGCASVLLAAVVLCHPVADTGVCDDWSYVRTAEDLAKTGHVVYNGWATAMLGWQLYPAAWCMRALGSSFLVARATTIVAASLTTPSFHRCLARCGVRSWNACVATLVVVLSPLFLPLATTYMSDMFGLLPIVVCLYCCLRAVQADEGRAIGWLVLAAISGVIGGTARQVSWLGLLVMVPSTAWLLRGQRRVWMTAATCWVLGCCAIAACMRWFHHQPYAVPETFAHARLTGQSAAMAVGNFARLGLETGMLLLPLLIPFLPVLVKTHRSLVIVVTVVCCVVPMALVAHRSVHHLGQFLVPTLLDGGNFVAVEGMMTATPEHGLRPRLLVDPLRLLLTLIVVAASVAVVVTWGRRSEIKAEGGSSPELRWRTLLVVILPFMGAYLLLLVPRAAFALKGANQAETPASHPYDRYSLPLLVPGALLLTRLYQDRLRGRLPMITVASLVGVGVYSVATTHDGFAMYRATRSAVAAMEAAGIPATAMDAGWEFSGSTQVAAGGFVHDPRLSLVGETRAGDLRDARPCHFDMQYLFPAVHPLYTLAFEPALCGGPTSFPPVVFHTWLPWRAQKVYVVRDEPR